MTGGEDRLRGSALRYRTFRLQILAGPADGYTVQALSPRGEGKAPFVSPFGLKELGALKAALGRTAQSGRDLDPSRLVEPVRSPEAMGEQLFEALFQGEILRLYERSVDLLEADPEAGLRIELMLDPRDAGLAGFQTLPWELMRQPGSGFSRIEPPAAYRSLPGRTSGCLSAPPGRNPPHSRRDGQSAP